MEDWMKQMRGRFSGAGSSIKNQRIPPQKTQSFKGETRTQNWFQKQFSSKMMSMNHDSDLTTEQVVGVAAAAYAINLIAETSKQDQKKTSAGLAPSLTRETNRKEDITSSILKPGTEAEQITAEGLRKGSESAKSKVPATDAKDEKATRRAPSLEKPLTFADNLRSKKSRSSQTPDMSQPENAGVKPGTVATKPEQPSAIEPVASGIDAKSQSATRPETDQTKADEWEKAEMAKIKDRYAKLNSTIHAWEEKKQKKARNKLDQKESGLEQKSAQAFTKFKNEMEYIKQVVDGARTQAQSRQRNDELKAKEKANIIRATGELPRTCLCC